MTSNIDRLELLVEEATSLALECYSEGDEAPFVLAADHRGRLQLFCLDVTGDEDTEGILELGRTLLADQQWACAVLVYAGSMPSVNSDRQPIVVMEPAKKQTRLSKRIVQPYEQHCESSFCTRVGGPLLLEG